MTPDLSKKRRKEKEKYDYLYDRNKKQSANSKKRGYGAGFHGLQTVEWMREQNPKSIIDVGCGQNNFINEVKSFCINSIGVDISSPHANIICPAHSIPVDDNSFEWLTSFDMMEHLVPEEIDEVLEEFYRISYHGWLFSISYTTSKKTIMGSNLHQTVRPKEWWEDKMLKYTDKIYYLERPPKEPYLYCFINKG